jgi:hypothetical protein
MAANGCYWLLCSRWPYLLVDAVDLLVLGGDLVAHVDGHVAQVADHAAHLVHVVLHLVLARVVRDPAMKAQRERGKLISGSVYQVLLQCGI